MKKKLNKKGTTFRVGDILYFIGFVWLGLSGLYLYIELDSLDSLLQSEHVVATSIKGYKEVCYKSHIESRKEVMPSSIDESCVNHALQRKCDDKEWGCIKEKCLPIIHPDAHDICMRACNKVFYGCIFQRNLTNQEPLILAIEFNCVEPAYVRNFTIEVCDEWIQVRKEITLIKKPFRGK